MDTLGIWIGLNFLLSVIRNSYRQKDSENER